MDLFYNGKYFPKNFILMGEMQQIRKESELMVQEAALSFPEEFNSQEYGFLFELRYVPIFDKSFFELKRLQGEAALHSRFKDAYRGYIIFDVSEYLMHEDDYYFDLTIKFLYDQSEHWKYIFLIDNKNEKAASDMMKKILTVMYCKIFNYKQSSLSNCDLLKLTFEEFSLSYSAASMKFFEEILRDNKFSVETIRHILYEILNVYNSNNKVDIKVLKKYFNDDNSIIKHLLSKEQIDFAIMLLEKSQKREGIENDEKI